MAASWDVLDDSMLEQWNKVAQAGKILVAHTEGNPDFDWMPAVYMCVRQVVAGLEDYAKQHLALHLSGSTSEVESLVD
jgi:hypothetical protein